MFRNAMLATVVCLVPVSGWGQEWGRAKDYKIRPVIGKTPALPPILGPSEISNLQTKVGGTFVEIQFETTHSVRGFVFVTNDSTGEVFVRHSPNGTEHELLVENLSPNTSYSFNVYQSPLEELPVKLHTLEFNRRTFQKNVWCFVENICMFDDSDDLSGGEFFFNFIIGAEDANFNESGNAWDAVGTRKLCIDSGTNLALVPAGVPNVLIASNVQSPNLKFAVTALEDDGGASILNLPLRAPRPDIYLGSFDEDSSEANSGFFVMNISGSSLTPKADSPMVRETLNQPFELYVPPSPESEMSYAISGRIVVSYVGSGE